jgi:hypothetical protein
MLLIGEISAVAVELTVGKSLTSPLPEGNVSWWRHLEAPASVRLGRIGFTLSPIRLRQK